MLSSFAGAAPRPILWRIARRYVAGPDIAHALAAVAALNSERLAGTIDALGEDSQTEAEARAYLETYRTSIEAIGRQGLICNISVKLSGLGLRFDPALAEALLTSLVSQASQSQMVVRVDMEDATTTDATLGIYRRLRQAGHKNIGIVLQCRLRRTVADTRSLRELEPNIRLCKGIYREAAEIAYEDSWTVRSNFSMCLSELLSSKAYVAIATHDEWVLWESLRLIEEHKRTLDSFEFQMLLGVRYDLAQMLSRSGYQVRLYVPFGQDWKAYCVRRLRENPEIARYVLKSFASRNKTGAENVQPARAPALVRSE